MKKILIFFILLPSAIFSQDRVKFVADGVTCSMCSKAIQNSLKTDKNITTIDPNLETQEWNIIYKKGTFKLESLKSKVEDAGFSVNKAWLNDALIYQKKEKGNHSRRKKN